MTRERSTDRARCGLCGQWAKADQLVGLVLVACPGITCKSHRLGVVGRGDDAREAFQDFLDKVEECKK